jgi:AcrR family transcriptional regulator
MARRSQHSQAQIKDMVFKAAENIVAEEGFAALKVREIAMEIGYTVGSIYMVFENMADLIMQIKGRTLDEISLQLNQVSLAQPPQQQLIELSKAYFYFAEKNFNRWSMIFEHRLPANQKNPDWYQEKVDAIFARIERLFLLLAPQAEPEVHKNAAQALWCGVHGVCILSLTGKTDTLTSEQIEKRVVLLAQCFIQGWLQSLAD